MSEQNANKKNIEYIAIVVLLLVVVGIGINRLRKDGPSDEVFSREEFSKKLSEVKDLEQKLPSTEKLISYVQDFARNPFKGPFDEKEEQVVEQVVVLPALKLQGMVWNSDLPQVIIDNKIYNVKDFIETDAGRIEIVSISENGILLKFMGREFTIRPQ